MASSLPTHCLKCEDSFSLLKPRLSLPCGRHALCKICTCKLELEYNRKCPKCKETWAEDFPPSLIEELQEKAKNTSEELVGASEEENPILVIARAYMVRYFIPSERLFEWSFMKIRSYFFCDRWALVHHWSRNKFHVWSCMHKPQTKFPLLRISKILS